MKIGEVWKQLEHADNPNFVRFEDELIEKRNLLDSLREENMKGMRWG